MKKHRILLVDDDKDLLLGMKVRLASYGFEVECAEDSVNALNIVTKEPPHLIILDLSMPGYDGHQFLKWIKNRPACAEVPIIVLTARDAIRNEATALESGAVAFFHKPVNNSQLLDAILSALETAKACPGVA
jgi:DNA-binding response OmpR family regulator